jgi:glycosyltransferase involved in cell wall biosynthesis
LTKSVILDRLLVRRFARDAAAGDDMKLDIHLQTHSDISVHGAHRYVEAPKSEILLRCTQSLVTSINHAEADIILRVFDDHSSPEVLRTLHRILETCRYPVEFIALDDRGYNASCIASFSRARDDARELVYLVEDDYLHTPSAIQEMLDVHVRLRENSGGQEVALHPYDDPKNYWSPIFSREECRVVYGPQRHWRTNTHTTNTCWVEIETLRRNWELFELLARYSSTPYGQEHHIFEASTINKIWREQVALFTPIPSLALHLQYEEHKDPYLDWTQWWAAAVY